MSDTPYRVAFTADEIKQFDISPNAIRAGFLGIPFYPPSTPEQEADLEYRIALTMYTGIMKLELQEAPHTPDSELLSKYVEKGLDPDLIRKAISRGREKFNTIFSSF